MNPRTGLPVSTATTNPPKAPMIIIPSTPRFRTPERSTTVSPSAASRIGTAEAIRVAIRMTGLIPPMSISVCPHMQPEPIIRQHIHREQEE